MVENEKIKEENVLEENVEVIDNVTSEESSNVIDKSESKAMSIASLVLGIVAFVATRTGLLALACGILAIIFGIKGQKRAGKGMAKAGMILGIVYVSLFVLGFLLVTIVGIGIGAALLSAVA